MMKLVIVHKGSVSAELISAMRDKQREVAIAGHSAIGLSQHVPA